MEIKDWIKENRTRINLSQKELAEKTNVVRQTISMYETGKRNPDENFIRILAEVFQTDTDFIKNDDEKDSLLSIEDYLRYLSSDKAFKYLLWLAILIVLIILHFILVSELTKKDHRVFSEGEILYRLVMTTIIPLLFILLGEISGRLFACMLVSIPVSRRQIKLTEMICICIIISLLVSYLNSIYYSLNYNMFKQRHVFIYEVFVSDRWLLCPFFTCFFLLRRLFVEKS